MHTARVSKRFLETIIMHLYRTHNCGEISATDENSQVKISGWVHRKRDHGSLVFIDLRDKLELKKTGKIPKSFSCPRGMLEFWIDPESPYHKDAFNQDKHYVFYCAAAGRSALAAKAAQDMGLKPVSHLEGGFAAWKKSGNEVETLE